MPWLTSVADSITALNRFIGRSIAWCTLMLVVLVFVIAIMRYLFKVGSISLQELVLYLHAIIFMLGAAYTLADDGHVRVDVFYAKLSSTGKAWVNLSGAVLFLLPLSIFIFYVSIDYVSLSWRIGESSSEAGGLPYLYLLKSLIVIMPCLLLLQGVAIVFNSTVSILNNKGVDD